MGDIAGNLLSDLFLPEQRFIIMLMRRYSSKLLLTDDNYQSTQSFSIS